MVYAPDPQNPGVFRVGLKESTLILHPVVVQSGVIDYYMIFRRLIE